MHALVNERDVVCLAHVRSHELLGVVQFDVGLVLRELDGHEALPPAACGDSM
jgi:hypothetical protein